MYTNIHAYDNESILKVSSIQTMRTTYFSDCTASNQINFNDIDLKHESYEVKFNFNDQPTFNNKDHMNLNDFGYFNIESDLDSCIDDHDFLSFQKVNDQSTSLQTYSNLKQTYLNIAPENDADSPITSTQTKLSFESELSKLCNLINSPNSDLNKLLDEVVFSTLNDSSMTNNEAQSKSSIAELNITKDSNSTKKNEKIPISN